MKIIIKWLIVALALLVVSQLVPGIEVASFYTALIVALVLGLVPWAVYIYH
jgi:putative membrane protein